MKTYEIWRGGYRCSGMEAPEKASKLGKQEAESFQEACDLFCKLEKPGYYNSKNLTLWGCGLYDNEVDARKFLG